MLANIIYILSFCIDMINIESQWKEHHVARETQ